MSLIATLLQHRCSDEGESRDRTRILEFVGRHADPFDRGIAEGHLTGSALVVSSSGDRVLLLHPTAPRPLDVDVHDIPARGDERAHQHLDLRYLVLAPERAVAMPNAEESHALRWFRWDELESLDLDPGLVRALAKARTRVPVPAE